MVDVDRLRPLSGAGPGPRGERRTAELLGLGLRSQDPRLGSVRGHGTGFRPRRHALPAAQQNQRHLGMLIDERERDGERERGRVEGVIARSHVELSFSFSLI